MAGLARSRSRSRARARRDGGGGQLARALSTTRAFNFTRFMGAWHADLVRAPVVWEGDTWTALALRVWVCAVPRGRGQAREPQMQLASRVAFSLEISCAMDHILTD